LLGIKEDIIELVPVVLSGTDSWDEVDVIVVENNKVT
jgi:hypothetical protein